MSFSLGSTPPGPANLPPSYEEAIRNPSTGHSVPNENAPGSANIDSEPPPYSEIEMTDIK